MDNLIYFNNINSYRRIALNSYDDYCKCEHNLSNIRCCMGSDGDMFHGKLLLKKDECAFQTIIFSALSIEAFINDYLLRYLGKSYLELLDKLEIKNKLIIGTKLITNREFPKDKKAYELFTNLVSMRNKLAHCKTRKMTLEQFVFDTETLEKKDVINATLVYELIIEELLSIQPDLDKEYLIKSEDLRDWHYLHCI